jgi:small nuclear ribonucleoprotein G
MRGETVGHTRDNCLACRNSRQQKGPPKNNPVHSACVVRKQEVKLKMCVCVAVKLNANRQVSGTLRGFDQFMNVVLDKAHDDKLDVDLGMVVRCSPVNTHQLLMCLSAVFVFSFSAAYTCSASQEHPSIQMHHGPPFKHFIRGPCF